MNRSGTFNVRVNEIAKREKGEYLEENEAGFPFWKENGRGMKRPHGLEQIASMRE